MAALSSGRGSLGGKVLGDHKRETNDQICPGFRWRVFSPFREVVVAGAFQQAGASEGPSLLPWLPGPWIEAFTYLTWSVQASCLLRKGWPSGTTLGPPRFSFPDAGQHPTAAVHLPPDITRQGPRTGIHCLH